MVARRLGPGLAVLLPMLLGGCGSALDLERARRLFQRPASTPTVGTEEVPLAAPESLQAHSGRLRAIALSWDPVLSGEVAGYVVERGLEAEGPFERIATLGGRFRTAWVDRGADLAAKHVSDQGLTGLGDGERYHYRVRSFRGDGAVGAAPSPVAEGATADAPVSPEGLRAYSHLPRSVALSWRPVDDPTVAGYVVYRSPSAGGDYRAVARIDDAYETSFVDEGLGALRVFYYRVAAVNAAGGEGSNTEPVRAVTKPRPLPPVGLAVVERKLGTNRLSWEANVEPDLAGYRLLRMRSGSDGLEPVAEVGPEQTAARDAEVGAAETVRYAVVAFDADGLESTPSETVSVEGVGYGASGNAEAGGVRLRWDPAVAAGFQEVRVLRQGLLRARELGRARGHEFLDQEAGPEGRYRYVLIGVRADGTEAPASLPLEVEVPRAPAAIDD